MSQRNAHLTVHGRRLMVQRVRTEGIPVAHVANAMRVSRQRAHRGVARFDAGGDAGLDDRSSRPHRTPTRVGPEVEAQCWLLASSTGAAKTGSDPSSAYHREQ